ncbi:MAG: SLC26A/SulP transporter family protein [Deltaproteobacteria bacterium]|nr:SLC26A/SulP transporter family protein [Deltaproteobacteria bacterium]
MAAGSDRKPESPAGSTDAWGGLAAALVVFPSSIAFGVACFSTVAPELSGMGALAGIFGAAALGLIAPVIGRNGGLITAPCAPAVAVLSAVAVDLAVRGLSSGRVLAVLALVSALAAVIQVAFGLLRAGSLIKFIPYQVVSGYLSGVALIIASGQIPKLLGAPRSMSLIESVWHPMSWRWPGIVVGLVTISVMLVAPRLTKRVPGAILALLSGIAAYFVLALALPELRTLERNSLVIGPVTTDGSISTMATARLTALATLELRDLKLAIVPALTLAVLLSIDTLKTGVVLDAMTRRRSKSDRELVGQGVANGVSFLLGGLPGAGTTGPTLVNLASGGAGVSSGIVEGVTVIALYVLLGSFVAWVPIGALAGILIGVAFRMFDFKMFKLLRSKATAIDFVVIAAVVVVAEGVGLIEASLVGVVLAILLFMREQVSAGVVLRKGNLTAVRSTRRRSRDETDVLAAHGHLGLFVQLRGSLFFGTTDQLFTDLEKDMLVCRFVLLDLRRVRSIDYTGANLLKQMHERLHEREGELLLAGMPTHAATGVGIERYLRDLELVNQADGIRVFATRDGALEWMEDVIIASASGAPARSDSKLSIDDVKLFASLSPESRGRISGVAREWSVGSGQRIFSAGELGDELFVVRKGRVNVLLPLETGQRHHVASIGPGEFFGELTFLDGTARTADAEAAEATDLFVISRRDVDSIAKDDVALSGHFYRELARAIAGRLRAADGELRALEVR